MTNTIPNVSRELLERASNLAFQTQHYPLHEELRALLSAPSPAGVDGLEVIGWYTEDHLDDKSATTYSREVADRWLAKGWPITGIANAADAQAIIDGLRGEVARYKTMSDNYCAIGMDANQRIGELEGLLRKWRRIFDRGPGSGQLGVLRGQTDAALSAGKEGE